MQGVFYLRLRWACSSRNVIGDPAHAKANAAPQPQIAATLGQTFKNRWHQVKELETNPFALSDDVNHLSCLYSKVLL